VEIAYIIYVLFNDTAGLDECLITYYYSISKFKKYHEFLIEKKNALFTLLKNHINVSGERQAIQ
jgi:hypothetical protein